MWWFAYLLILVLSPWVGILATIQGRVDVFAFAFAAFLVSSILVRNAGRGS